LGDDIDIPAFLRRK